MAAISCVFPNVQAVQRRYRIMHPIARAVPVRLGRLVAISAHETKRNATSSDTRQAMALPRSQVLKLGLLGGALSSLAPKAADALVMDEQASIAVFEQSSRSVVFIGNLATQKDGTEKNEGIGSGVIWDKAGHVVTNYHVVARLATDKSGKQIARVGVLQADGTVVKYDARVAGLDNYHDLAVLQIDAPPDSLLPVKVGTSGDIRVGQSCYAIGSPFGLENTLTAGLVSGLNRSIPSPTGRQISGVIQTDAAINAGNSGGALLDGFGRLIGINTATFTRQGSGMSSGVNFALPVDLVYDVVPDMVRNYGKAT